MKEEGKGGKGEGFVNWEVSSFVKALEIQSRPQILVRLNKASEKMSINEKFRCIITSTLVLFPGRSQAVPSSNF